MTSITRGTTPTIKITTESDVTGMNVYLTISQGGSPVISKHGSQITIHPEESGSVIEVKLTQEETLFLEENVTAYVQFRAAADGGSTAIASEIGQLDVKSVLRGGVIE